MLDRDKYLLEEDVEFLFERPVGWSSACLDSTIDYYLDCNHGSASLSTEEDREIAKH